jgi:integrase
MGSLCKLSLKENPKNRSQKKKAGFLSRAAAEGAEKEMHVECVREVNIRDDVGLPWSTIVEKWYEYEHNNKLSNIGPETLSDYLAAMKKWTAPFWKKPAEEISRSDIREVITNLSEAGCSKGFQAKVKMTINKIFNWGIEESYITGTDRSPTIGIKIDRKAEKVPDILTIEHLRVLLSSAKKLDHPWRNIWHVAILTGCRSGELYALEWSDIDFEEKLIRISKSYNNRRREIKSTKSSYWRNVPINNELMVIFKELKATSNTSHVLLRFRDWTHGIQATILRSFLVSIGLPPVRFHALRACFATHLLKSGVSPASIMKIGGWKDLETMARYIRLAGIDEKGVTENLRILDDKEALAEITSMVLKP